MVEINNTTKSKINEKSVKEVAEKFLKLKKINAEVSIAFVGDMRMKKLNKIYRRKDKTTDVLSFAGEGNFFGEVLINFAQIKRQASKNRIPVQQELDFILVHGLLHLTGMEDDIEEDRLEMIEQGREIINLIYAKSKKAS